MTKKYMVQKEWKQDHKDSKKTEIEKQLLENMIQLQKVHTNLAERFDRLSTQISSLLGLFEIAAKNFAKNQGIQLTDRDKDFLDKVDKLLEQNKTIAKGLTLMEDRIRERMSGAANTQRASEGNEDDYQPSSLNRPLPRI